ENVASLWRDEVFTGNFQPGKTIISTDCWSSPGRFSFVLNTKPDMRYAFELSPRGDSMLIGMAGGIVGLAAEAAVSENSGAFQIMLTDEEPLPRKGQKKKNLSP